MTTLQRKIALSLFPGIGAINARKLVAYLGNVDAIFDAPRSRFTDIPGIGKKNIELIMKSRSEVLSKAENELQFIEQNNIKTYFYLDKNFPRRLAQCPDAPIIFYVKGAVNLDESKIISIVGTRHASDYGREQVAHLLANLKNLGIQPIVVSGLAFGIDVMAHKSSLKNGFITIGVVAHGLDKMYPAVHRNFAKEILQKGGAILTDFISQSRIDPGNFLRRNRIIAGLADCTIVVESAEKGGSLVTADIANSYNREVFAFPGRSTDVYSKGCNNLIKENKAALISSATDLVEYMGWDIQPTNTQPQLLFALSENEQLIVDVLQNYETVNLDVLAHQIKIPISTISSVLLELEFKGIVNSLPGNRFKLKHRIH